MPKRIRGKDEYRVSDWSLDMSFLDRVRRPRKIKTQFSWAGKVDIPDPEHALVHWYPFLSRRKRRQKEWQQIAFDEARQVRNIHDRQPVQRNVLDTLPVQ